MDFREIAGRPRRQLLEALELAFVLSPPPRRIGRLVWSLEFDKSPCRRAHPLQGNIRPTDAGISIFGLDDQPLGHGQERKPLLEQPLKRGGQRRFGNTRVRSAQIADALCIGLQEGDAHCPCPLPAETRHRISDKVSMMALISTLGSTEDRCGDNGFRRSLTVAARSGQGLFTYRIAALSPLLASHFWVRV